MKWIITLFSMFYLVFSCEGLNGQCSIKNISVSTTACYGQGRFSVEINFEHNRPADATFRIQGNGTNYGNFFYRDLPIIIENLNGNCITGWDFIIRDNSSPICSDYFNLGTVCCQQNCNFEVVNFNTGACNEDNTYTTSFHLANSGGSNNLYDFYLNNNFIKSFESANQPIVISNLSGSSEFFDDFKICLHQRPECCTKFKYPSPCFCSIYNVRTRIEECNIEDESYFVKINFDHIKTSDSFYLGGDLKFWGSFAYSDLPVTIGPINYRETKLNALIADRDNFLCFQEIIFPYVDSCATLCELSNLTINQTDCGADEDFYFFLEFEAHNPELSGFTVIVNDTIVFESLYTSGEYFVGPLAGDCVTDYRVSIKDKDLENCFINGVVDKMCCGNCRFDKLNTEVRCENHLIKELLLDFEVFQAMSDSFVIVINGIKSDTFAYDSKPVSLDISSLGITDENIEIYIFDSKTDDCAIHGNIENPCILRECFLDITEASILDCDPFGNFSLLFSLHTENVSDSLHLSINNVQISKYEYRDSDYFVHNLKFDCGTLNIVVQDIENPLCADTFTLENTCCETCELIQPQGAIVCNILPTEAIGLMLSTNPKLNEDIAFRLLLEGSEYGIFQTFETPILIENFNPSTNPIEITTMPIDFESCVEKSYLYWECGECEDVYEYKFYCENDTIYFYFDLKSGSKLPLAISLQLNEDSIIPVDFQHLPLILNNGSTSFTGDIAVTTKLDEQTYCTEKSSINLPDCVNNTEDIFARLKIQFSQQAVLFDVGGFFGQLEISVFDLLGRKVGMMKTNTDNIRMDISAYASGMYLMNLTIEEISKTIKFVKY